MSQEQGTAGATSAGLTRRQAIPLAIGSVAGAGILFLPSAVYVEAGSNVLIVWVTSVLLCVPMLLMFEDMVRTNPAGDGIEAFVRIGLGDALARCVPAMFLALVVVGLPAGSLVAGRYVSQAFGSGPALVITAAAVLLLALGFNLAGVRTSNRVQQIGTWALIAMAVVLLVSALSRVRYGVETVIPDSTVLNVLLPTVVLAFWAFAGFENLTFLSREFRNPKRDFLPVSVIALTVYGVFTILLTLAIAFRIPLNEVDEVTGLLQLAGDLEPRRVALIAVTVIAFGSMVLNAVSWVWGLSKLIVDASSRSLLPVRFAVTDSAGTPRRALALLAALFTVVLAVLAIFPAIVVDALATASAIFILMYALCILSYLRVRGLTVRSGLNAILLVVMVLSLIQSGWRSLYGLVTLLAALAIHLYLGRRKTTKQAARTENRESGDGL
ncbi:APC family permease [Amycolatopsis sp. cmx-11-12]|uniref:APC family permease n=1 Tax=Amycolatopsis sp. cmx-11-12 TaxID=2785795 RepID=UPI003917595D